MPSSRVCKTRGGRARIGFLPVAVTEPTINASKRERVTTSPYIRLKKHALAQCYRIYDFL